MIDQPYSLKRNHFHAPGKRWDRDRCHIKSFDRRRAGAAERKRLGLEWLEPRHLLAASPASSSIAAVQPYNGAKLSQTPQNLVITFNGLNVPALMGSLDVQLEELNRDGTKTPIWNFNNAPIEDFDATGTELIVPVQVLDAATFASDNLNLSPGNYEIDLVGGTGLAYAASGAFGPGPQLWDPNQDHEIGTFTILGQGATLSLATPLGAIGANLQTEWGSLDPENPTNAVNLYQFTLPQGHFWQVGLEISTHGIGSPLLPGLALLDSNGNVLATADSGMGLPSDPNDPYLFMGLAPGTYYVGVSAEGNLPNLSGGYNPVLGIPGTAGVFQQGGPLPFALGLVAAPHDQPTSLLAFTLDNGDPTQSEPTGITLRFSGPINLSNLFVPDTQETALEVVDSSGQVWPITPDNYVVAGNSLEMIFDKPLPSGGYTLISAASGGLVDLAGQPISGTGGTSGVLAHWTVAANTAAHGGNNLGVLWPNSANANSSSNSGQFAETTILGPGQTADFRWTVIVPGFYKLQTELSGGPVAVIDIGKGGTVLDPGTTAPLSNYIMNLNDGVQTLRFVNEGSGSVTIDWLLTIAKLDWEKIIDNGVGQTFALTLGLPSTVPSDSGTEASANLGSVQAIASAASGSASNFAGAMGPVPATLLVTLNSGLIGQPTLGSQSVAAVGPSVAAGSTALTDSGNSLLSGIQYGSTIDWSEWLGDPENLANAPPGGKAAPRDIAVARAATGARTLVESDADGARADDQALGQAQWLVRLGARLQRWLTYEQGEDGPTTEAAVPVIAASVVLNARAGHQSETSATGRKGCVSSAAHSDLGAVAGVILVGATACRLRKPLLKWWRMKNRLAAPALKQLARPLHRGPHASSVRARATARPGKKAMR